MNQSMHEMYKTSNSRRNSEEETVKVMDDSVNLSQIFTEVNGKVDENPTKTPSLYNDSGAVADSKTPSTNSALETASLETPKDRKHYKKSAKKEGSSFASQRCKRRESSRDIITDDAGNRPFQLSTKI